jgi:predicted small lipoprotein YifL
MRQLFAGLSLTALLALQAGCGQTGPLYMPGETVPGAADPMGDAVPMGNPEPMGNPVPTDDSDAAVDRVDAGPTPVN